MAKSKTTTTTTAPAPTETKSQKSKKTASKKEVVAAPAPVPEDVKVSSVVEDTKSDVTNEVVELSPMEEASTSLEAQTTEFFGKLQTLSSQMTSLKSEFKTLEKQWTKTMKVYLKATKKRKRQTGDTSKTGFNKPVQISKELAAFIGQPFGTEVSRAEITKLIHNYVKSNNLKDANNGRIIHPDKKLNSLLKVEKDQVLSYFNLQKYMSCHYCKKGEVFE